MKESCFWWKLKVIKQRSLFFLLASCSYLLTFPAQNQWRNVCRFVCLCLVQSNLSFPICLISFSLYLDIYLSIFLSLVLNVFICSLIFFVSFLTFTCYIICVLINFFHVPICSSSICLSLALNTCLSFGFFFWLRSKCGG